MPEGTPAPGAGRVTPPETSPALALGQRSAWSRGGRASAPGPAPPLRSPAAPRIAVTPSAAFNQLLQLVNFTQRPKEQTTGRQECRFLQLVQRASGSPASWPGEPCSAAGTCHIPGGTWSGEGCPTPTAASGNATLLLEVCGEILAASTSAKPDTPQRNRRQQLWRSDCSEDGLPLPALHSCVRGGDTSTS